MSVNTGYDIGKAFDKIENELIASMIRNMRRHKVEEIKEEKQWTMWQVEQLKALEKYKKENRQKYQPRFKDINSRIEGLIRAAKDEGSMDQELEILKHIKDGFPYKPVMSGGTGEFFRLNNRKLEALIKATSKDMERAETAILRMAEDKYRQVIFDAQVYANTGAGTYEKAVDMATKDFLAAGINCVEYKNGARHTLSDYADMALRTAGKRAYLQGEGEKRKQWGIYTVKMNKRGNPCPKCLPFCGKVFIDDVWSGGPKSGVSPVTGLTYPLMSAAVAAGLYHPRCRDHHSTYYEGISTPPSDSPYTQEQLQELADKHRQQEQQQYAERQAAKYARLATYSLDGENKMEYKETAEKWDTTASSYKYPINQDMFTTLARPRDDGKNIDVIRPHNIIKALNSCESGIIAYKYIQASDVDVELRYNLDNEDDLYGEYDLRDNKIIIYVDKTKTITETAQTIVHEATHARLGCKGTRKEEIRCFLEEEKFKGNKLTPYLVKCIIKAVNENAIYKELPWR